MGCGQSKIHLYPRKSKSKANGKKGGHADSDAETDEEEGHINDAEKNQNRENRDKSVDETDEQSNKDTQETDEDVSVSLLRAKNLSLLQSQEISTSQQNFFRMLDKKIEEGPDYDSASETEIALEEARLNALVQHWESASLTASICSSASRSLQTTPIRQIPMKQLGMMPSRQQTAPNTSNILQAQTQMPTQVINADFLTHGMLTQNAQLAAGPLKQQSTNQQQQHQLQQQQLLHQQLQQQQQQQQQQLAMSHMNTKMLHQMSAGIVPQIPMSMPPETTAITSNALALMQAPNQQQQYTHLLTLPGPPGSSGVNNVGMGAGAAAAAAVGSPQLLGNSKPSASPKRMIDARILMNQNPLAQQMQSQPGMQQQQIAYYGQPTIQSNIHAAAPNMQLDALQQTPTQNQTSYYGDVMHTVQPPTEYRFPPAISVQRLAPQVQRQLRETQELIKDSCPQLYAAYGSPGPPIRSQTRNPNRRPTLETQFSQELS